MQDARNGPRMDEDPLGLRHGVAGGPVGCQHGLRGEVGGQGKWRNEAKGKGTSWGCQCSWTGESVLKAPSNRPVGLGNLSPWSGEPLANHGERGNGKSGKCPEPRDGHEVSAGLRADPEAPGSRAGVPLASGRRWTTIKYIQEPSGYSSP